MPNVGSLLDCSADIYQLDVLYLMEKYDDLAKEKFEELKALYLSKLAN